MFLQKNIYLTGFMGSGKTTVGSFLARKLGCSFIDLDREIEAANGLSIFKIFQKKGEDFFRNEEQRLLLKLSWEKPSVVSLGGGAILRASNREVLKKGHWVNLRVPLGILFRRLSPTGTRPLLGAKPDRERMELLLRQRAPFYNLAPLQIEGGDLAPDALVEEILRRVG